MQQFAIFLLIQIFLTWTMVGITCFTQVVHFPLYRKIKEGFVQYERSHIRRTALLLGPLMLLEAVTAVILISVAPSGIFIKLATTNFIFLIFIWLSTFLLNIYQHQKLSIRFSKDTLHDLITSNWIRLVLWAAKGALLLILAWYAMV